MSGELFDFIYPAIYGITNRLLWMTLASIIMLCLPALVSLAVLFFVDHKKEYQTRMLKAEGGKQEKPLKKIA